MSQADGDLGTGFAVPVECDRLHQALRQCHRRVPPGRPREVACRHLNRSLAECLVSMICPDQSEAVRSLCTSGGTALKRSQCEQAQEMSTRRHHRRVHQYIKRGVGGKLLIEQH